MTSIPRTVSPEGSMGGKRPDQHSIDPGESGSTDKKWSRQGLHGDEHIADEQKQKLQSNPHDQPLLPEENLNPALRELRERKQQVKQPKRDDADADADARVDEASEESFPASDPPAY